MTKEEQHEMVMDRFRETDKALLKAHAVLQDFPMLAPSMTVNRIDAAIDEVAAQIMRAARQLSETRAIYLKYFKGL